MHLRFTIPLPPLLPHHSRSTHPPPPAMSLPVPVPPAVLHFGATIAAALLAHFLHLPSLFLYSLHTYIHPDAVPSSTPRAVLRPPAPATSSKRQPPGAASSPFDASSAQLFRLRLSHSTLSSRPHFPSFHLSLLLPLSILPPALLLPTSYLTPLTPLLPVSFLFFTLARHLLLPSPRPGHLACAIAVLLLSSLISSSPFAGALASVAALPAARFARSFWLGTDQLRSGLAVLSSSCPSRLLFHVAVFISSAVSVLHCCGFLDHGREQEVAVLAAAAGLQLLATRGAVQMYLNEAVFCWYQRLHASRAPDTEYGRAKVFLHNHHLCSVATQLAAPPLLVLSLLALWRAQGEGQFEGVHGLDWLVGWSAAVREAALLAAQWVVETWSAMAVATLVCYRRGWLLVL